jgi:hypothetical protein
MNNLRTTILIFVVVINMFCKSSQHNSVTVKPTPEKYNIINLKDSVNSTKVIAFKLGEKAVIFFRENQIRRVAKGLKMADYITSLDSALLTSDTVSFTWSNLSDTARSFAPYTFFLAHEEVENGVIKILLKKENVFATHIYYYIEKDKTLTTKIYCLPDKTMFYFYTYHPPPIGAGMIMKRKQRK